jgi:hypothetical protein
MYCSTCGAAVPPGRSRCMECGTRVARSAQDLAVSAPRASEAAQWDERGVGECPRCAYRGEGIPYFSRGTHVAALVGATVLTAGAMGAGGLVYYVVRRDHRVCPRCGLGLGKFGERIRPIGALPQRRGAAVAQVGPDREGAKTAWSYIFFVIAAIMIIGGIASFEVAPILFAGLFAGGGVLLRKSAGQDREERRAAIIASLQLPVLKLATECDGRLTVTEVAAELGWTMPRAEKVLDSLEDGVRVVSDVTDEGVIVYEFREILNAPAPRRTLTAGNEDDALPRSHRFVEPGPERSTEDEDQ